MSLSYAFKCDICGTSIEAPIIERPPEAIPDQWATLTIKHPNEPERAYKGHVCAICAEAIESGESLDIYRMRTALAHAEPMPVTDEIIPVVSEIEAREEVATLSEEGTQ